MAATASSPTGTQRQRLRRSQPAEPAQLHADPTVKAMIAQLARLRTPPERRRLEYHGLSLQCPQQRIPRSVCLQGRLLPDSKHSFTGTYNYINNPTDRPDQGTFYTVLPPVSNIIKDHLLAELALDRFSHADQRIARRLSCAPTLRSWRATISEGMISGLLFTNPVNTFMNQGRRPTPINSGQRQLDQGKARSPSASRAQIAAYRPLTMPAFCPPTRWVSAARTPPA